MRVRRAQGRSVVTGSHRAQGMTWAMLFLATTIGTGLLAGLVQGHAAEVVVIVSLALLIGAGAGYRVVIDREGITVWMTCWGVPWRRRRYGLAARPSLYWAWEDKDPTGAVIKGAGDEGHDEWMWIFGSPSTGDAIVSQLHEEIAWVRG